jgi:hypothetical protein
LSITFGVQDLVDKRGAVRFVSFTMHVVHSLRHEDPVGRLKIMDKGMHIAGASDEICSHELPHAL